MKEVGTQNIPIINMFNKIDLIGGETVWYDQYGRIQDVYASAQKSGLDLLKKGIVNKVAREMLLSC